MIKFISIQLVIILGLIMPGTSVFAQDEETATGFIKANESLKNAEYEKSINLYTDLLAKTPGRAPTAP